MRGTQYIIIVSFLFFQSFVSNGQNRTIDSLKQILQTQKEDTDRVNTLNLLSIALSDNGDQNEAMKITDDAILISKKVNFKKGEAIAYSNKSVISFKEGDYLASLINSQSAIKIFHDAGLKFEEAEELDWAGGTYQQQYNYEEASRYFGEALKLYKELKNNGGIARTYTYMWITLEYSVAYYDPYADSIREYKIPNAERYGNLRVDNAGEAWVSTFDGLVRFDQQKNLFIRDARQRSGATNRLAASGAGVLVFHFIDSSNQQRFIGKRNLKGNYEYEPYPLDLNRPGKDKYFNDGGQLFILLKDSTRIIIINDYGWAYKAFDQVNWTFKKLPNNERIPLSSDITVDPFGNIWLNNIDTLTKINIVSGNKTTYVHDKRICFNSSVCPCTQFWFCANKAGCG